MGSEYTEAEDSWKLGVIGADYLSWGDELNSSNVTILQIQNTAPQIIFVSQIPAITPIEANSTAVKFNATVYDSDGFSDINASSIMANFTRAGESLRQDRSCINTANYSVYYSNYSCSIDMWYFDSAGTWNVSVSSSDNFGANVINSSTMFTYNQLSAIVLSPLQINFGSITTSSYNQTAISPTTINNTGNANLTGKIALNAINLLGETISSNYINAANISASISTGGTPPAECSGNTLQNATDINITGIILDR